MKTNFGQNFGFGFFECSSVALQLQSSEGIRIVSDLEDVIVPVGPVVLKELNHAAASKYMRIAGVPINPANR